MKKSGKAKVAKAMKGKASTGKAKLSGKKAVKPAKSKKY